LTPVLKLQHRLEKTLGHSPPLSELITRAIGLANVNLPAPSRPLSADELFDEIIGASANQGLRLADGNFIPAINSAASAEPILAEPVDIFDELIAPAGQPPKSRAIVPTAVSEPRPGAVNDFSLTVSAEERQRATVFLQRMKSVLEIEPGRLVL
jgi:hypothetical protein